MELVKGKLEQAKQLKEVLKDHENRIFKHYKGDLYVAIYATIGCSSKHPELDGVINILYHRLSIEGDTYKILPFAFTREVSEFNEVLPSGEKRFEYTGQQVGRED